MIMSENNSDITLIHSRYRSTPRTAGIIVLLLVEDLNCARDGLEEGNTYKGVFPAQLNPRFGEASSTSSSRDNFGRYGFDAMIPVL
jgi:hypothetical protein